MKEPTVGSSVLSLSPLEAWLTGGAAPAREQRALDPLGLELQPASADEDDAAPREAMGMQFLVRAGPAMTKAEAS